MVSFTCNYCQDVVKKPKVISHSNSCGSNSFSCVDCMQVFDLNSIKAHTSCVSEVEKYQGQWRNRCTSNGNPVRNKALDSDDDAGSAAAAKPAPLRPPRPAMNDLSESDSDEDWVSSKKKAQPKKGALAAVKRSRTSNSDEDEDHAAAVKKTAPKHSPKQATASKLEKRSATATPLRKAHKSDKEEEATGHKIKKSTPLLLPRSTASDECTVPSFVLGSSAEVTDIVADILAEQGVKAMREKDLAKKLVTRYAARIAKSVRHAIVQIVEDGSLVKDDEGLIRKA